MPYDFGEKNSDTCYKHTFKFKKIWINFVVLAERKSK